MAFNSIRAKSPDVRIETQSRLTSRSMRTPKYNTLYPNVAEGTLATAFIAPVLAGDTLKSATMMARIIGQPVEGDTAAAVLGKWFESWLFYVRVGDMANAEDVRSMLIDPSYAGGLINFETECFEAIWRAYFADDDANGNVSVPSYGTPAYLKIPGSGWWDSLVPADELPDVSPAAGDQWQEQWIRYQALRRARLTTSTWEEYLAKSGVSVGPQLKAGDTDPGMRIPELLRWTREFAYPQPAGFSPDGSVEMYRTQWFIQSALEKARFCAEPGFVVAMFAVRPKSYIVPQVPFDAPAELLQDAQGWLPMDFDTDPHTSLVEVSAAVMGDTVPGAVAVVDVRDLYLYGDNKTSVPASATGPAFKLQADNRYPAGLPSYAIDMTATLRFASRVAIDATA